MFSIFFYLIYWLYFTSDFRLYLFGIAFVGLFWLNVCPSGYYELLNTLQIEKRLEPMEADDGDELKQHSGCTIFLGYTSNLISSGVRESIRYLVEHKMVQLVVMLVRNCQC